MNGKTKIKADLRSFVYKKTNQMFGMDQMWTFPLLESDRMSLNARRTGKFSTTLN